MMMMATRTNLTSGQKSRMTALRSKEVQGAFDDRNDCLAISGIHRWEIQGSYWFPLYYLSWKWQQPPAEDEDKKGKQRVKFVADY